MTNKMSELDNENAGATDDSEVDDIELINDEIDTTMMAAETTGQKSLKMKIRSFLELFTVEKDNLVLTVINDTDWDKNNNFWAFMYKEKPLRNYDTVRNIFAYMTKMIQVTDWNQEKSDASNAISQRLQST